MLSTIVLRLINSLLLLSKLKEDRHFGFQISKSDLIWGWTYSETKECNPDKYISDNSVQTSWICNGFCTGFTVMWCMTRTPLIIQFLKRKRQTMDEMYRKWKREECSNHLKTMGTWPKSAWSYKYK